MKKETASLEPSASAQAVQTELSYKSPDETKYNDLYDLLTAEDKNPVPGSGGAVEEIDPEALKRGDIPMSVVGHLNELRRRLLVMLGCIILFMVGGFFLSDHILKFINDPFARTGNSLNLFALSGGVFLRLKVAAIFGLFVSLPVLIHQTWRFVVPAVETENRLTSRATLLSSIALFYGGTCFIFFLFLPFAIRILMRFITSDMNILIGAGDYVDFILFTSLSTGIMFEMPILALLLTRVGILSPAFLIQKRKYAYILIFIISGFIAPDDFISQIIVAIPLLLLYEFSIIISKFSLLRAQKKRNRA